MSEILKKKRGKNFTSKEEQILLNLVEEHKEIIENKKSDSLTWKEKERTWNKIAKIFAATSGTVRESKALRDKYDAMKRQSKVELAAEKSELYRTGGGSSESCVSSVSKQIEAMLGDSATGMPSIFDSDKTTCESNTFMSGSGQEEEVCEIFCTEDNTFNKSNWESWNPTELKEPKSKRLRVDVKKKRSLEETKIELTLAQKAFYEGENQRAEEKHKEENRRAEEKHQEELTAMKLQNELLKLELMKKQKEIND